MCFVIYYGGSWASEGRVTKHLLYTAYTPLTRAHESVADAPSATRATTTLRRCARNVPTVIVANEHYGRLARPLTRNVPVRVEVNVDAAFTGDREEGFNVLAEIPGVDPVRNDQVVMVGAHLDSWPAGTGATDDGAGVLIAMEAMRILRAIGVQPRRTIRIALWTGEEQGALGSLGYLKRHVASVPRATTDSAMAVPEFLRRRAGPIVFKAEHARISAIFTLDAGGGRIRGISVGTQALAAIFEPWVAPLRDLLARFVHSRCRWLVERRLARRQIRAACGRESPPTRRFATTSADSLRER